ncbi:hypothetical protein M1M99_02830 [Thermodesulfovibrionales bacterium]|nr:hypothetical protein [Thermodesulfovibrionales bacterium]
MPKLPKPEELSKISLIPPEKSWMDAPAEIREKLKNSKQLVSLMSTSGL